jgi:hypothetical protein
MDDVIFLLALPIQVVVDHLPYWCRSIYCTSDYFFPCFGYRPTRKAQVFYFYAILAQRPNKLFTLRRFSGTI